MWDLMLIISTTATTTVITLFSVGTGIATLLDRIFGIQKHGKYVSFDATLSPNFRNHLFLLILFYCILKSLYIIIR